MTQQTPPNRDRFDFNRFIDSIVDLDFFSMFHAISTECGRVEASMSGRGGPKARADGGGEYVARLKCVAFWFHHGQLANNGSEFSTCRRIAKKLIEKKQIKPEALEIFRQSKTLNYCRSMAQSYAIS